MLWRTRFHIPPNKSPTSPKQPRLHRLSGRSHGGLHWLQALRLTKQVPSRILFSAPPPRIGSFRGSFCPEPHRRQPHTPTSHLQTSEKCVFAELDSEHTLSQLYRATAINFRSRSEQISFHCSKVEFGAPLKVALVHLSFIDPPSRRRTTHHASISCLPARPHSSSKNYNYRKDKL